MIRKLAITPLDLDYDLHPGDANLNATTDVADFNIWNTHKFQSGTDWSKADFDGSTITDVADFNIWNQFKFTSARDGEGLRGGGGESMLGPDAPALDRGTIEVIYNVKAGSLWVDANCAGMVSLMVPGPQPLRVDRWLNETRQEFLMREDTRQNPR